MSLELIEDYLKVMSSLILECSPKALIAERGVRVAGLQENTLGYKGEPKACYSNCCSWVILHNTDRKRYFYAEGVAYHEGIIPLDHAVIYDKKTGGIICPTGWRAEGFSFIGLVYDTDSLADYVIKTGSWGVLGKTRVEATTEEIKKLLIKERSLTST